MSALASPELLWLAEGLIAALLCGLFLAFVVAVLLLAAPGPMLEFNRRVSRWIDTRGPMAALERPLLLERLFYRHHRLLGGFTALGAAYVLWRWAVAWDREAVIGLLGRRWISAGLDWIVAAVEFTVVGLHVAIFVAGVVILLRPSLLKAVEQTANRWHQGLPASKLDAVLDPLDRGVGVYPRVAGLVLLATSGWCLAALLPLFLDYLAR